MEVADDPDLAVEERALLGAVEAVGLVALAIMAMLTAVHLWPLPMMRDSGAAAAAAPGDVAVHFAAMAGFAGLWLGLLRNRARRAIRTAMQQRRLVADLRRQAMHDGLTGLPNRAHLAGFLRDLWTDPRGQGQVVCIVHVDLDRFTSVNDRHGYAAGDRVLVRVADILRHETRASDFVARVGGDEFVIVVPDARSADMGQAMARRLGQRLRDPIHLGEERVQLGASLGLAHATAGEGDPETVLAGADLAQNAVKRANGDGFALYSEELHAQEVARARLRDELSRALEEDRFTVHFQPQIDLRSGAVTGMEALMRWDHPERGQIMPGEFIGVAEESGLIVRIGRRVIASALDRLAEWRMAGLTGIEVGINLSARELGDRRLIEWLRWEVDMRDLPPASIRIEMLETVLIGRAEHEMGANMRALAGQGFGIDLDDFGTGRSSLSNLLFLKVDRLKLDRSFISGLDASARQQKMVNAMVSMARSLGVEVLAEGVETPAEAEAALRLGCSFAQGFWIAPPMPADEVPDWVRARGAAGGGLARSG